MILCPWCDEDVSTLLIEGSTFRCRSCGTCIDHVEEDIVLEEGAQVRPD